jgi:hypothetical protein
MLALARTEETLEEALRAALGAATSASGAHRGMPGSARVRCIVCQGGAERRRTLEGGFVTACDRCGSVLEEEARPQLRLV